MPKAEAGSTKALNNKMKSKGLQRLRWYCQACEKQCRDENGFKCHTQSESHVRQIQVVGADPRRAISDFSETFKRDFLLQLRTGHGTKAVQINHFYQGYIADKEHIHMNATRWPSLTEFAKFLGREGICRVEETDKGIQIAWIDNSPEALRRQDALRKKERGEKGDEERENHMINEQIERARREAAHEEEQNNEARMLQRSEGEKVKLIFGAKPMSKPVQKPPTPPQSAEGEIAFITDSTHEQDDITRTLTPPEDTPVEDTKVAAPAVKISLGATSNKPMNVFAAQRKSLATKKTTLVEPPKKMSEAERIMKEDLERKRPNAGPGMNFSGLKRQRIT
ncbi:MAG: hypothetical protein M1828_007624 [Chrysothrix sp. TS-e1954]|nr:MAG: hypothetical protein M1828_007624 [Chrysothrix sp. TS-e1954]